MAASTSTFAAALVLLMVLHDCCMQVEGTLPKVNPLCRWPLSTEIFRYRCFRQTLEAIVAEQVKTSPLKPEENIDAIVKYMAADVKGKTNVGDFAGSDLSAEYLVAPAAVFGLRGYRMVSATFAKFVQGRYVVSAEVNYNLLNAATNATAIFQTTWWLQFNSRTNLVASYNIEFQRLGEYLLLVGATPSSNETILALQKQAYAGGICTYHNISCAGTPNQQYASFGACMQYIVSLNIFNPGLRMAGNTSYCRLVHALLVRYDPKLHCPHIGPTGGGKCTNVQNTYADDFTYWPAGTFVAKRDP